MRGGIPKVTGLLLLAALSLAVLLVATSVGATRVAALASAGSCTGARALVTFGRRLRALAAHLVRAVVVQVQVHVSSFGAGCLGADCFCF